MSAVSLVSAAPAGALPMDVAALSHELKTPVVAMLGFAQLIASARGELSQAQRSRVEVIEQAGAHILGLITDVLAQAREGRLAEAANEDADGVELADAMVHAVLSQQRLAREHGVELCCEPVQGRVRCTSYNLRRVLGRLLEGALSHAHGGRLWLRPVASPCGSRVGLQLQEQGVGHEDGVPGEEPALCFVQELLGRLGGGLVVERGGADDRQLTVWLPAA